MLFFCVCLFLTPTLSPTLAAGPQDKPGLGFLQNKAASATQAKAEASVRAGERNPILPFVTQRGSQGNGFALEQQGGGRGWRGGLGQRYLS
jgi:hypothetical protein